MVLMMYVREVCGWGSGRAYECDMLGGKDYGLGRLCFWRKPWYPGASFFVGNSALDEAFF